MALKRALIYVFIHMERRSEWVRLRRELKVNRRESKEKKIVEKERGLHAFKVWWERAKQQRENMWL